MVPSVARHQNLGIKGLKVKDILQLAILMVRPITFLTFALFTSSVYGAETTLFIPGFDPQPLSVDYISTDANSHTVWALHAEGNVVTLVEGSDYVSLGYSDPQIPLTIHEECSLANNVAVCTVTSDGDIQTGTLSPITELTAVIGTPAPSAPPTATSTLTPGASVTSITPTSLSSSSSASGTSTTPTASTSSNSNSACSAKGRYSLGVVYTLVVALLYCVAF